MEKVPVRDVDALLAVGDGKMAVEDRDYLEKHGIKGLIAGLMEDLLRDTPKDPVQFMIDSVEFSSEFAKQDQATGLPEHRRSKLEDVFKTLDKAGSGAISFDGLQAFSSKHGGVTLGDAELRSIFNDFAPQGGTAITLPEFFAYFAKVSCTMPNAAFTQLIKDLMT
ncbi:hypothetical protein FOA52_006285 [Chlamydomonas sp. UWO 241]|nr:hypothetical protein FOA52_006285 [Chlamydomonas sp. UWO 241]